MNEQLVTQEELEDECPLYMDSLEEFIDNHPLMKDRPEAVVYVLGQILHERLQELDLGLEDKGLVVSTLLNGFIDANGDSLAAYRELQKMILEQKTSTTH